MIKNGGSATRPAQLKPGMGNATYWGTSFGYNHTPMVGAIAWWKANVPGAGSAGHVAYVEQVVSATEIVVSESNYGNEFDWRRIKSSGPWPTGFIHYKDVALTAVAAPAISGTAKVGVPLRASAGSWSPSGTYSYQWYASGVAISGARSTTFTPTAAQQGRAIQVRVTASRASYVTGVSTSAATAPAAPGTQTVVTPPAITGTAQVDQTLTASTGTYTPTPASVAVQWLADGVPIPGARSTTYVPTQDVAEKRLSVAVTTTTPGYTTIATPSAPTDPVLAPDITVAQPGGVEGRLLVGQQLTADPGVLEPRDARATYVWMRDNRPIPAVSGQTYRVAPVDIGRKISVRVQLTHTGYRSKAVVLGPVGAVKAPTSLRIKFANGRTHEAWVKVIVRTPDTKQPSGLVWVRLEGHKHLVRLIRGVGKIHVTGLRAGRRTVVALYTGDARTTRVRTTLPVTVKGARARHR
jgi:surface antigen